MLGLWVKPGGEGKLEWEMQWVKSGDWELGDHMIKLCCCDSKLKWVKVCIYGLTGDALLTMRSITEPSLITS